MRALYSLLLYLLLPAVLLRLWIRGGRDPGYRLHWGERFGRNAVPRARGVIWLHAVSVGEVRAAEPLIRALLVRHPGAAMLVTVMTPTGRRTVRQLFGDSVHCRYLPYDLPGATRRFVAALQPSLAIFMEVELWPNLYAAVAARGVPLYLVNARLSRASSRGYSYIGGFMRATLSCVRHIAAQTEADRKRFTQLGVSPARVSVTGNLKFDVELPADLHARGERLCAGLAGRRPVWVAASTHEGEEAVMLAAHAELLQHDPHALLLLVPRHPERAAALVRQCNRLQLDCRLSSDVSVTDVPVLLVDQLGLLVYCYAVADAAFIGGSLVDRGGHNPIEALLAGVPVISGPYTANFADVYRQLQAAGAVQPVTAPAQLAAQLHTWFSDAASHARAVASGRRVVEGNRGALAQVLAVLDPERPAENRAG